MALTLSPRKCIFMYRTGHAPSDAEVRFIESSGTSFHIKVGVPFCDLAFGYPHINPYHWKATHRKETVNRISARPECELPEGLGLRCECTLYFKGNKSRQPDRSSHFLPPLSFPFSMKEFRSEDKNDLGSHLSPFLAQRSSS